MNNAKKCLAKAIVRFVILALVILSVYFLAYPIIIPSESMYPSVKSPCFVLKSSLIESIKGVKRFDVVEVLLTPEQSLEVEKKGIDTYCKRVIGLPGEKVEIKNGLIYINDSKEPLDEKYLPEDYIPNGNFGPYYVPDDSLFLLGDNRDYSRDSRILKNCFFKEKNVKSLVWCCISKDGISVVK